MKPLPSRLGIMELPRYWPFYCEENIWHLCRGAAEGALVLFISNPARSVPMMYQRAAPHRLEPVFWDYHVIIAVPSGDDFSIIDLDTTLETPVPARRYLEGSFELASELPVRYAPRFRVIPAEDYRRVLSSDRRHMRTKEGYKRPVPPWPQIGDGEDNLARFIDMESSFEGTVLNLDELTERLAPLNRRGSGAPHR